LGVVLLPPQAGAQSLIATVPAGTNPVALAVNPATNKIFAVNQGSNNVTVIDGATNGAAATVTVGQSPDALAVNPLTNKIYVSNRSGNAAMTVIDGATYSATPVVTGQATPVAVAANPLTNRVYVVNQNSSNVTVIESANSIIATVAVGFHPRALAINSATNKIYVANISDGSVTVIDGASNSPARIYTAGIDPYAVAVNAETNRIYVANLGGTVSVIDGAKNSLIASVPVGTYPCALAVNPVSNKIYVANYGDGTVSVIDGASDTLASVAVDIAPIALAIDSVTGKIYVTGNQYGAVTVIDGVDDSVADSVTVGTSPDAIVLNSTTNTVYVANSVDGTVSVLAGASSDPLQFIPVTPCRVADTRNPNGPFGGPPISGGTEREFVIPNSGCGVPPTAAAYSLNVTVVPAGPLGYLTVWAAGLDQPAISTLNSLDGRVKANAAIVPAGAGRAVSIFASNTTNVVLDINGYFAAVSQSTLAFYPLTPCRVVDTRWANGPLGGPILQGGAPGRDFPMTSSGCNIPASALAYSLNFTAVPKGPLGYLTTWPAGQGQPVVSTLNALTGVVTANAAIVPAGKGGDIQVFVSNDSHVVIDTNGYFGPEASGGLSLYAAAPCRVLDTRNTTGAFSGKIGVNVAGSPCAVASTAQALVLSATVVPQGPLGYLTLWPDGAPQPTVSTLNAIDGAITSNLAIVPTTNGWIDAFASNPTQLILDSSSYFGP
jgi:YVTN family beta-propeller protein